MTVRTPTAGFMNRAYNSSRTTKLVCHLGGLLTGACANYAHHSLCLLGEFLWRLHTILTLEEYPGDSSACPDPAATGKKAFGRFQEERFSSKPSSLPNHRSMGSRKTRHHCQAPRRTCRDRLSLGEGSGWFVWSSCTSGLVS